MPTATAITNDLRGYLATDADSAEFIEWTDAGGTLAGTIQWAGPQGANSYGVKTERAGFSGVRAGDRVTLTIPAGLGFSTTLSGTISGNTLTLFIPNDQGVITPTVYQPATLTDYNRAVAALQQRAAQQEAQAVAAQATADAQRQSAQATADAQQVADRATAAARDRQQGAVRDANAALADALHSLSYDSNRLAAAADYESPLNGYAAHWSAMQHRYEEIQHDAAVEPFDCARLANVRDQLSNLHDERQSLNDDRSSLNDRVKTENDDLADVQRDMQAVQAAWSTLQAATAANPTGAPGPQFSKADIDRAMKAAQQQIDTATSETKRARDQASAYDSQAANLDETATAFVGGLTCPTDATPTS